MIYSIAIYTDSPLNIQDKDIIILHSDFQIIDNYSAKNKDSDLFFDYLITDDISLLKQLEVEFDNNLALVNYDFQTTLENVFAFNKAINSSLSIDEQINKIITFIKEN